MVARVWGKENGKLLLKGGDFHLYRVERVMEADGGDGCTTLRMYLIQLNYIHLKIKVKKIDFMLCVLYHNKKQLKKNPNEEIKNKTIFHFLFCYLTFVKNYLLPTVAGICSDDERNPVQPHS